MSCFAPSLVVRCVWLYWLFDVCGYCGGFGTTNNYWIRVSTLFIIIKVDLRVQYYSEKYFHIWGVGGKPFWGYSCSTLFARGNMISSFHIRTSHDLYIRTTDTSRIRGYSWQGISWVLFKGIIQKVVGRASSKGIQRLVSLFRLAAESVLSWGGGGGHPPIWPLFWYSTIDIFRFVCVGIPQILFTNVFKKNQNSSNVFESESVHVRAETRIRIYLPQNKNTLNNQSIKNPHEATHVARRSRS